MIGTTQINYDDYDNDGDDDYRAKQSAAAMWFNRGDLSYQAVPSVRVSVSTEHLHSTPVCSPVPVCPVRRCGCRPSCPGPCRRAVPQPLPPPPPIPPRQLVYDDDREVTKDAIIEPDTGDLVEEPPSLQHSAETSPDEDEPVKTTKKNLRSERLQ